MKREAPEAAAARPSAQENENAKALREQLVRILRRKTTGQEPLYEELVSELQALFERSSLGRNAPDHRRLQILLSALATCASELVPSRHADLCKAVLDAQFIDHPPAVQEGLLEVLLGWMLTNCTLITGCLNSLAISLVPFKPTGPQINPQQKWTPPEPLPAMQEHILNTVDKVYGLQPQVAAHFLAGLYNNRPFATRHHESHCLYLTAIFQIRRRPVGRHFQEKLWSMAFNHLLGLDASLHHHELEWSGDLPSDLSAGDAVFEVDLEERPDGVQAKNSQSQFVLMDTLMELTLEEMEWALQGGAPDQMWQLMLFLLDTLLLTWQDVHSTHFIVFYLAQKRPIDWVESLTQKCLQHVKSDHMSSDYRCACASYIGSFLARARFAPVKEKLRCLEVLLTVCEEHVQRYRKKPLQQRDALGHGLSENSSSGHKHQVFYVCIQASLHLLYYVLPHCHSKSSTEVIWQELRGQIQQRLSVLLYHELEPMNCIHPSIALEFAELMEELGIIHCRHLINTEGLYQGGWKLKGRFPFDPYYLPRSGAALNLREAYVSRSDLRITEAPLGTDQEYPDDEKMTEGTSLEESSLAGSSLPYYNSLGSSWMSDYNV